MYNPIYNKDGSLKHSTECQMAFGRKDEECPRCLEMLNGAPARKSWHKSYYAAQQAASNEIKAHFSSHKHLTGGCGAVCTYGEW
jgi:hypothetical protein